MSLGGEVAAHLPYLRRYARALAGSQTAGDDLVRATIEAALADPQLIQDLHGGRASLYRAFSRMWAMGGAAAAPQPAGLHEAAAQARLRGIAPAHRQALLLTTLEGFSHAEAAAILELDPQDIARLVRDAVAEIDRETATSVLIIEDEPLIALQLEDLVRALGHTVSAAAATRAQALAAVGVQMPGLVLADIQLADGSSGLDAVEDILALTNVPVIFITSFPERLLTGDRLEPTYLVTKPFQESSVRAAISQALFFGSGRPLA